MTLLIAAPTKKILPLNKRYFPTYINEAYFVTSSVTLPLKKEKEKNSYSFSSKVCLVAYTDLPPKKYFVIASHFFNNLITVFHVNIMV